MATLVLTVVGTAVGGPIGGAIGAALGQQVDQRLLAPKGRRGPRLGDLSIQTSSYGSAIPKLFGTMRAAGTVIWATDLVEARHRSGGGKGRSATTSYSYSVSFAVLLSGRPVERIGRIWADGNLLRGQAGDWKTPVGGFRLHRGTEDQPVDPLIASAEGIVQAPAYRGLAYVVFEGFELADYGNRIPSLTFEIVADAVPPGVGGIAAELSGGAVTGDVMQTLAGYAAGGDSVRGAIEGLAAVLPLTLAEEDSALVLADGAPSALIPLPDRNGPVRVERRAAGTLPDEIALSYYEPERDYQAGLQRARRGGPGRRVEAVELAAALPAGQAKALAEGRLMRDWAGRTTARLVLPWRHVGIGAGQGVVLAGRGERWRVAATTLEGMSLTVDLVAVAPASGLVPLAASGRAAVAEDVAHGATRLALLDLPPLDGAAPEAPRLWIAAAGVSPGWRRAALLASLDGGTTWTTLPGTAPAAVMGAVSVPPVLSGAALIDTRSAMEVTLLHDGMTLVGQAGVAALAEANLAMVGEELIQFEQAVQVAPARWRLTGLLRGRRGTEAAITAHPVGTAFVLVDRATLLGWDPPASAVGAAVQVMASGVGDAAPVVAAIVPAGRALMPPVPVHLRAWWEADGTMQVGWTRRDRAGWTWRDGDDVPLSEPVERYRVTFADGAGRGRTVETTTPAATYSPAQQAADGLSTNAPLTATVRQVGGRGLSAAAAITPA